MANIHVVSQGECMATIARQNGFPDVTEIWNHPKNQALRDRRMSPSVLLPGDVVHIPDVKRRSTQCETGKIHTFRIKLATRGVHVVFVDADGEPIANSPYVLRVGHHERKGHTSADGAVDEKGFDPGQTKAELELTDLGITRILLIGHLDPHHEDSGWRQRLANLGHDPSEDGLADFARDRGLPEGTDAEKIRHALYEQSRS